MRNTLTLPLHETFEKDFEYVKKIKLLKFTGDSLKLKRDFFTKTIAYNIYETMSRNGIISTEQDFRYLCQRYFLQLELKFCF